MMNETGESLQSAVTKLTSQLYDSAERFDTAAASLRVKGREYHRSIQDDLERFIETFETFQTGCFQFYVRSKRFGILKCKQDDGSFLVSL
jgi:hypothetical protein